MSFPHGRRTPSQSTSAQGPSRRRVLHGVVEHPSGPGTKGPAQPPHPVQAQLAQALEAWWRQGVLPSPALLRDGLLALEAGVALGEAERGLLLRAALFHGKGMLTALAHQPDPERIAAIMVDMLLNPQRPMSPKQVKELLERDPDSQRWRHPLILALQTEAAQPLEPRRTLAQAAILHLQGGVPLEPGPWLPPAQYDRKTGSAVRRRRSGKWRRRTATLLGWAALLLALVGVGILLWSAWEQQAEARQLVTVPSGIYLISDPANPDQDRLVRLGAFTIQRTEVTNRAYRTCYEEGGCPLPSIVSSMTRPNYLLDPAFDDYPVVHVTWAEADAFCAWAGMRLPLEEEWEVAAASAQTAPRRFRYPWGDFFDRTLANGAPLGIGDTEQVGSHSPAGDSPFGLADMAGNVAEWTATPGESPSARVVKGGSFLDGPERLEPSARLFVPADEAHPWLGFRCAVTSP